MTWSIAEPEVKLGQGMLPWSHGVTWPYWRHSDLALHHLWPISCTVIQDVTAPPKRKGEQLMCGSERGGIPGSNPTGQRIFPNYQMKKQVWGRKEGIPSHAGNATCSIGTSQEIHNHYQQKKSHCFSKRQSAATFSTVKSPEQPRDGNKFKAHTISTSLQDYPLKLVFKTNWLFTSNLNPNSRVGLAS